MTLVFLSGSDPDLEKRVSDLEKRVTKIEEKLSDSGPEVTNKSGDQDIENWRKLTEGMSQERVKQLLGAPRQVDGGSITIWNYSNGGSVTFMDGKVFRWSEPF